MTLIYRFFGLSPFSTDDTHGRKWNAVGIIFSVIWISFILLLSPLYITALIRLQEEPDFCGIFGSLGVPFLLSVIVHSQTLLHLFFMLVLSKRISALMSKLNQAIVEGLDYLRRLIIFYAVGAICIFLLSFSYVGYVTSKVQMAEIISFFLKAEKGTALYEYYLFGTHCFFPLFAFSWMVVILVSSLHVFIAVAFVRQFRHVECMLRSAVTFGQVEMLRRQYFVLARCLASCDDVLSYTALTTVGVTVGMSCIAVNADLKVDEFTLYQYVSFNATISVQLFAFCSTMFAATWMNERVKSVP